MRFLDTVRQTLHPLHRLRKSAVFRSACRRFDRLKPMRVAGIDFPISGYIFKNFNMVLGRSLHEAVTLEWFARLATVNGSKTFWDVGANVGLYGFTFISGDNDRTAVLFEPDPDNLTALHQTVSKNALDRWIETRPCAVSARSGTAAFKRDEITGATGALATPSDDSVFVERHFNVVPDILDVPVTTLDEEVGSRPPPDIIKIDVEGHEMEVFSGGSEVLAGHRPILLFETSRDHAGIQAILTELGYVFRDAESGAPIEALAHNTFALCAHHQWPE